jgi:diadenosine tetraphosphate (Ap4A) HIT family hydrolase
LIIPKYHSERLHEVPDQYLADILPLAKKIALSTGHADYNLLQVRRTQPSTNYSSTSSKAIPQNNGKPAFQHVPHVHVHVIPKPNMNDGMIFRAEDFARKVERPKDELIKVRCSNLLPFEIAYPDIQTLENMQANLSKL